MTGWTACSASVDGTRLAGGRGRPNPIDSAVGNAGLAVLLKGSVLTLEGVLAGSAGSAAVALSWMTL
jgi:hypothetical protein